MCNSVLHIFVSLDPRPGCFSGITGSCRNLSLDCLSSFVGRSANLAFASEGRDETNGTAQDDSAEKAKYVSTLSAVETPGLGSIG